MKEDPIIFWCRSTSKGLSFIHICPNEALLDSTVQDHFKARHLKLYFFKKGLRGVFSQSSFSPHICNFQAKNMVLHIIEKWAVNLVGSLQIQRVLLVG